MSEQPLARIVIFARPEDPADLRDLLQQELGLNKVDAGIAAHHAPGLVPKNWPEGVAQQAAAAITHAGLRSVAVAASSLPNLSRAETVHHIRCGESGLEICNLSGDVDRVWSWDDLQLISVGRIPLHEQRHYVTDTVTRSSPVAADEYLKGGAIHGLEAWLFFDGDGSRILRCDSEHMNYEYLGDRKTGSGTANFELFMADISVAAPGAFLTPSARKYLTRGPLLEYDFKDSESLQEHTLVQYVLARELRPR